MLFPQKGIDAIRALYKANPQDEPARKRDIKLVGEQMCFDLGNKWGNKKRAGLSDDFRSADSIAFHESDGTVSVWDIQASSGQILVSAGDPPTHPNIPSSEATFMPCIPINHMENGETEPPIEPPNTGEIEAKLDMILANQEAIMQTQSQHTDMLTTLLNTPATSFPINFPDYRGRISFGGNTTFVPIPKQNNPDA